MEETLTTVASVATRSCANCGQPALDGDHPTPLCGDCRERLTRLHIPVWIWIFAGCIAVLLLFSLFTLPRSISLGMHLEKGKRALKEKKFNTAENEFSKVLEKVPSNIEARGNLLIASFYNQDLEVFLAQVKKLDDKAVSDEDNTLYGEIEKVMLKAEGYFSNDTFEVFKKAYPDETHIPDTAWDRYLKTHTDDRNAVFAYASLLYDRKNYHGCDSLLDLALQIDYEYIPALMLGVNSKRDQGDLNGAMTYVDRILAINPESVWGLSAKARTLLRQKKIKPGLDLALRLYDMNKQSVYAMSTLILAYHFNGRTGERDALIKKAQSAASDSIGKDNLQYALDVINNKEKF
jgi:tetratricopeptide (TPR) repeat protein